MESPPRAGLSQTANFFCDFNSKLAREVGRLTGYFFSRTQEYAARRRGESHDRYEYATQETDIHLTPHCDLK
jgi:hypothetical protein